MTKNEWKPLDFAVYAMITEQCAQVGEPWTREMQESFMKEDPEQYHERVVQVKCAIKAFHIAMLKEVEYDTE